MTEDNPNFSERYGYQVSKSIQYESMDDELRTGIWNFLYMINNLLELSDQKILYTILWRDFLKKPLPFPNYYEFEIGFLHVLKSFIDSEPWYKVYDLLEFFIRISDKDMLKVFSDNSEIIIDSCNDYLEAENSGYRIINGKVTPIINTAEIESIEDALETTETRYQSVFTHLEKSLNLLSSRESPDYKNSIKESISAIESLCCLLANDKNVSLNKALGIIEKNGIKLHPAFKEAINKLYGYTSDEGGIRHKEFNPTNVNIEDAKFMLVSCTNFINYLIVKADKAGIVLE